MTEAITIQTPFNDVAELTDNFATRVDETQLMLPYSQPLADDVRVAFTVLLADGSVALEGVGRTSASQDNGADYPPEYRYDVVLDSLELAGMSEVMFERFLQARSSQLEGEPGTGEVDVGQLAAIEEEAARADSLGDLAAEPSAPFEAVTAFEEEALLEPASEPYPIDDGATESIAEEGSIEEDDWAPPADFGDGGSTQAVSLAEVSIASAPPPPPRAPAQGRVMPAPPSAPRGTLPLMHRFEHGVLTRPSLAASWAPEVTPRPDPMASSGLFDAPGGLPRPFAPPHPEMPEEARVHPAPSPSAPWSAAPTST